jgi:hypothetical protein
MPKEQFLILTVSGPNGERLRPDIAKFLIGAGMKEIPAVSFIKSDEGFGRNLTIKVRP